ncbi:MAG: protein BatD [Planctomycetes bacterium]|nr:protein BatD [Planctomycetota bacterium]
MRRHSILISALLICGFTPAVLAGNVKLLANSSEVYVGVPFAVAINVTASEDHRAPKFPKLKDATSELVNTQTTSNSMTIRINGRQVGSGDATTQYVFHVTPTKEGILKIPRISVQVDGEVLQTRSAAFRVTKSEKGDLLYVELIGAKEQVYVGEGIEVTLRVWLKEFKIRNQSISHREMWQAIDKRSTNWGAFADLVTPRNPNVKVARAKRSGADGKPQPYLVFTMTKQIWPNRAGKLNADDVRIVVDYPLKATRDIFGGLRFSRTKPIASTVDHVNVTVLDIPSKGRPADYAGAVGKHTIRVTASPTEVRVGDPITLNMVIQGTGQLEHLQAPRLSKVPDFAERFQIGDDSLPGVVENQRKTFTQSIRALSDDVTEIPSVPLSYFDTVSGTFETAFSEPIPLDVAPAQKMSNMQIVQSGGGSSTQAVSSMTRLGGGIEANRSDMNLLLADQRIGFSLGTVSAIVASPLLFGACLLVRRRKEKLHSNPGLARRRAAYRTAMLGFDGLSNAGGHGDGGQTVMTVLLKYIGDRLGLESGGLTRKEATTAMSEAGIVREIVDEADLVMAKCEVAEFGADAGSTVKEQVADARECVERIEKQLGKRG